MDSDRHHFQADLTDQESAALYAILCKTDPELALDAARFTSALKRHMKKRGIRPSIDLYKARARNT